MKKSWLWFGLVVLIVVAAVGGVYFFRLRQMGITRTTGEKASPTSVKVSVLPNELTSEFNPTINTPVFAVTAVGGGEKSLRLKMIYPEGFLTEEITSTITCRDKDIKIIKKGEEIGGGSALVFDTISQQLPGTVLFKGLCRRANCQEINKQCELNLI